jgi:hypothetical protein
LCNGDVVPLAPTTSTIIEFTHRLYERPGARAVGRHVRLGSPGVSAGASSAYVGGAALGFMLGEAAIGAGIVLLELVENNASALRAIYQGVHLTNTMFPVGGDDGDDQPRQGAEGKGAEGSHREEVKGAGARPDPDDPGRRVWRHRRPRRHVVSARVAQGRASRRILIRRRTS